MHQQGTEKGELECVSVSPSSCQGTVWEVALFLSLKPLPSVCSSNSAVALTKFHSHGSSLLFRSSVGNSFYHCQPLIWGFFFCIFFTIPGWLLIISIPPNNPPLNFQRKTFFNAPTQANLTLNIYISPVMQSNHAYHFESDKWEGVWQFQRKHKVESYRRCLRWGERRVTLRESDNDLRLEGWRGLHRCWEGGGTGKGTEVQERASHLGCCMWYAVPSRLGKGWWRSRWSQRERQRVWKEMVPWNMSPKEAKQKQKQKHLGEQSGLLGIYSSSYPLLFLLVPSFVVFFIEDQTEPIPGISPCQAGGIDFPPTLMLAQACDQCLVNKFISSPLPQ